MTKRYEIMFYVSFKKKLWPYYIFVDIFICDRLIGLLLISFDRMKFVERQCIISWLLLGIENNDVIENTKSIIIRKQTNRQKICRLYWPSLVFEFRQTLSPFKQCHRLYLCLPCLCLIIFIEYLKNSYNLFFEVLLVNQPIVNFVWMVYQIGWENKMWVVQMIYNMSN